MSFEQFDLHEDIQQALKDAGFEKPTPIQEKAIPLVREGRDLVGSAQTGTGKTAAFLLPTLDRLLRAQPREQGFQVLILEPTRELAIQVQEQAERFARTSGIRCHCVYGGVGMAPQEEAFKSGVEIIVATPGRLLDHFRQGWVDPSKLSVLVLDEADRMLDMGFIPDVRQILKQLPTKRQTLFFSATITGEVKRLSEDMLTDPATIAIEPDRKTAAKVAQGAFQVAEHLKPFLLGRLLDQEHVTSALVFTQTKVGADKVCAIVERHELKVAKIHGDLTQAARQQALQAFKSGEVNVLVATDVAARGIDVDGISHVINFNPPESSDDYIHRIGRTARADKEGHAYTLFAPAEAIRMGKIEKDIKMKIERKTIDNFDYNEPLGPQHEIRQGHNVGEFRRAGRSGGPSAGPGRSGDSGRSGGGRNGKRRGRGRDRKDSRGPRDDGAENAEVTIRRAGSSSNGGQSDRGERNRSGRRDRGKEAAAEREKRQAAAGLTATDVLRKASEQTPVVDDTGLNLRPPSETEQTEESQRSQPRREHGSGNGSKNKGGNRGPSTGSGRGSSAGSGRNSSADSARNASEGAGQGGRNRRRRRRSRGRRGRGQGNAPTGNTNAPKPASKGGFFSKIKSLFSGK